MYKKLDIDFNKIYNSNSCGPFKIIEDLGLREKSRRYVKIKFINTGTEKEVRYDIANDGKVNDELYGIDFSKIYYSLYYGPFIIISYIGRNKDSKKIVKIRFINTGYEYDVPLRMVIKGTVIDRSVSYYSRRVEAPNKDIYDKLIFEILAERWNGMMSRCYNKSNIKYNKYGALGVTVCNEWKSLKGFINTIHTVDNFNKFYQNPQNYELDKDYLQSNLPKNKRVYSPQTCTFLSCVDNANLSIKENHKDKYYGVKKTPNNNYIVTFSINGRRFYFGTYSNFNAALNEYNYYYIANMTFERVPLLNEGMPYMNHEEAQKYLVKKNIQ